MNTTIQRFARQSILDGLSQCTDGQILMFKRMYSHRDIEKDIKGAVADMDAEKLDRAMEQVEAAVISNKMRQSDQIRKIETENPKKN